MIKLESANNRSAFKIDNKPYQRGNYELVCFGEKVGLKTIHDKNQVVNPTHFSEWVNGAGDPYASVQDLLDDMESLFFLNKSAIVYSYVADNYTDLSTVVAPAPEEPPGVLAYVYNAQGTKWLPGTIGGTYYPQGAYVWTGTEWISDRNNIAAGLQDVNDAIDQTNNDVTALDIRVTTNEDDITNLDGRVTQNETDINDLDSRVTQAETDITTLEGRADQHDIDIANHEGRIAQNELDISNLDPRVTQNEMDIAGLDARVGVNETDIAQAESDIVDLQTNKIDVSEKGQPGGVATLNGSGQVPSSQLPSYLDDVLEFANLAAFPPVGESGKIYIAIDTNLSYRWSGSIYVKLTDGGVNSFNSRTGNVLPLPGDYNADQITETANRKFVSADQKDALAGSSGVPSAANKYVTELGLLAALTQVGAPVTRPINGTPFVPSATKYVRGSYTVQISATISLSGSQNGTVFLEVLIGAIWTIVGRTSYSSSGSITLGLNLTTVVSNQLNGFFTPGQQVRLRQTGNATISYISGQESTIG